VNGEDDVLADMMQEMKLKIFIHPFGKFTWTELVTGIKNEADRQRISEHL
jgi:hypothetical protein